MRIVPALGNGPAHLPDPIVVKCLLVATEIPVVIWTAQVIALLLPATFTLTIFGVSAV
ncbi:MAG TPA: hypothetical protein VGJ87_14400 [Roseiflexaceae bacterium]|jgi:hypothetical protein